MIGRYCHTIKLLIVVINFPVFQAVATVLICVIVAAFTVAGGNEISPAISLVRMGRMSSVS